MKLSITKKVELSDWEELEEVFEKIENSKIFRDWFGTRCPTFCLKCEQCRIWTLWQKFKIDVEGGGK